MITTAIIAEFNPLHKGHKYIIDKAREDTKADYIVVLMSGDYVQRGEPALLNKHCRTQMALDCGADLVIELPMIYATASAAYFAEGAVRLLCGLGCINNLYFASEAGDIDILKDASYTAGLPDSPNNILAREYINALKKCVSNITPYTTARIGSGYNSNEYNDIASATYIRNHFSENTIKAQIPEVCRPALEEYLMTSGPVFANDYSDILYHTLIYMNTNDAKYFDVYEDLALKLTSYLNDYTNYEDYIKVLKSKDITYSHISRALIHIILDITTADINFAKSKNHNLYARLLGFKKGAAPLLGAIKQSSIVPVISKLADAHYLLDEDVYKLLNKEITASNLYNMLATKKRPCTHECTRPLIISD